MRLALIFGSREVDMKEILLKSLNLMAGLQSSNKTCGRPVRYKKPLEHVERKLLLILFMYSYHGGQARVLLQRHLPTSQSKL